MEILQNICTNVAVDRNWDDEGLRTANLRVVDLEAQGLEKVPEWRKTEGGTGAGRVSRGGGEGPSC